MHISGFEPYTPFAEPAQSASSDRRAPMLLAQRAPSSVIPLDPNEWRERQNRAKELSCVAGGALTSGGLATVKASEWLAKKIRSFGAMDNSVDAVDATPREVGAQAVRVVLLGGGMLMFGAGAGATSAGCLPPTK